MPEIVLETDLSLDGATDDLGVIVNIVVPLLVGSLLFALCFYRWVTRGEVHTVHSGGALVRAQHQEQNIGSTRGSGRAD